MTAPIIYTAIWGGKKHTLSQTAWVRLTSRSRHFLIRMMEVAAKDGIPIEERMQFAVEQDPTDPRWNGVFTRTKNKSPKNRLSDEKRNAMEHGSVINRFLYSR